MFSLQDFAEPGDSFRNFITGESYTVPEDVDDEPREYQVSLSLPVSATSLEDAVEQFRLDVENGPDYIYGVDDGETLVSFDSETGESTPAARLDIGTIDKLATRVYGLAHEADEDEAVQTDWDTQNVAKIAAAIREALGF